MFRLSRRSLTPILLVASLQFAMIASGCGQRAGSQVDDGITASTTSSTSASYDNTLFTSTTTGTPLAQNSTATSSATATTSTTASTNVATVSADPVSPPVATTSVPPTPVVSTPIASPSIDPAYMLKAQVTQTVSHGLLWFKTLEAMVQVQNPNLLMRETGTVTVTFTLKGSVVEAQQLQVSLDPAEIRDYSVKSTVRADGAIVSVIMD